MSDGGGEENIEPGGGSVPISYFSLTAGGALLALRLRDEFGGIAHLPKCHSMGCGNCDPFDSISEALPERFSAGDTIICVMAAGIVFRILAPHLKSKQGDPAVIVIDEEGGHVIPLLGGHAAGANALSRKLALFLDAHAAITTSSDVQGLNAPDDVARRLCAEVDNQDDLRKVTALVVDGRPVCIEALEDPGIEGYGWVPPGGGLEGYEGRLLVTHMAGMEQERNAADNKSAGINESATDNENAADYESTETRRSVKTARLIPRKVAAGIGCKRGVSGEHIISAIRGSCETAGIDPRSIATLASIEMKSDEAGLAQAAKQQGAQLVFYPPEELAALGRPGSGFVERHAGTPAVSEPAALLAAGVDARLILKKTKHGGVTIALAAPAALLSQSTQSGSAAASTPQYSTKTNAPRSGAGGVTVVGTGAGTESLLTAQAAEAIVSADVIIGYRTYTGQIKAIFPEKEYIEGSMGAEMERCREAIRLAVSGRKVVMVSSGDPGVYGMAGPLLEMANGVPVSIIPGVTAAQIAAARLGAPLMNDYITLSLSDLLTPRSEVLRRAEAAAMSDMVICLYNPTSRKRQPLFEEVCALLTMHRPAVTPVGWVRDAGGPGEDSAIVSLDSLAGQKIDMRTVIIVGNSRTEVIGGRMVTRRGYEGKKP